MIVLALLGVAAAQLQWAPDLSAALRTAGRDRLVLAHFWKEDCPWCEKLEQETYKAPEFLELGSTLVAVRLQGDGNAAEEVLRFRVRGFPTLLFLNSRGAAVGRIQGFVSADALAFEAGEAKRRAGTLAARPRTRSAIADRAAVAAAQRNEKDLRAWMDRLGNLPDQAAAAASLAAGTFFEEEMRIGDAREHFAKAARAGDARVRAYGFFGLARTYLSTDRFAEAVRNLEASLEGDHLFRSHRELAEQLLKFARGKGAVTGGPASATLLPTP